MIFLGVASFFLWYYSAIIKLECTFEFKVTITLNSIVKMRSYSFSFPVSRNLSNPRDTTVLHRDIGVEASGDYGGYFCLF